MRDLLHFMLKALLILGDYFLNNTLLWFKSWTTALVMNNLDDVLRKRLLVFKGRAIIEAFTLLFIIDQDSTALRRATRDFMHMPLLIRTG